MAEDALNELRRYVEDMTGTPVTPVPVPEADVARLSLFLRSLYRIEAAELFGRRWVLAVQATRPDESPGAGELVQHVEQMRRALGDLVVLVLTGLTPYLRRQLLRRGVPFIAPGRQIFLPMAWVDLPARCPRRRVARGDVLSAAAQVVVLCHLRRRPVERQSLRVLAASLGYSPMTLSNVADELVGFGICRVATKGRSRTLRFPRASRKLWAQVRPRLRTPVQTLHWVNWHKPPEAVREAGLTALARLTLVSDDALPTYALRGNDYRRLLESGKVTACPGPEDAAARVECWAYDPTLLATERTVDPLSLILSLADSTDERVHQALAKLETELW